MFHEEMNGKAQPKVHLTEPSMGTGLRKPTGREKRSLVLGEEDAMTSRIDLD